MPNSFTTFIAALGLSAVLAAPALAQEHGHAGHGAPAAAPAAGAVMTAGEITRVDARSGKLTIRHETIANLDMPPMTMVFNLQDPQSATGLQPGARVRFHAEEQGGALVITRIEPAN
ncbi:copper-binding protein [Comamonas sp. GB3 AK4-5]|uniref:copper-binding protein n=1 Tax=Comamonas sp. GB3 AK4-5 TaxID=3231487 RepID=UPI00351E6BDA